MCSSFVGVIFIEIGLRKAFREEWELEEMNILNASVSGYHKNNFINIFIYKI